MGCISTDRPESKRQLSVIRAVLLWQIPYNNKVPEKEAFSGTLFYIAVVNFDVSNPNTLP